MEIQDNQSAFLGKIWPELALAWLGFDGFGIGLRKLIQDQMKGHAGAGQGAPRLTQPRRS